MGNLMDYGFGIIPMERLKEKRNSIKVKKRVLLPNTMNQVKLLQKENILMEKRKENGIIRLEIIVK